MQVFELITSCHRYQSKLGMSISLGQPYAGV